MAREFGGEWTRRKLDILENYLRKYLIALSKSRGYYSLGYIDAFAGEGAIQLATARSESMIPFEDEVTSEVAGLIRGSAQRALALDPGFDGYVFIETDPNARIRLQELAREFPDKKVHIVPDDANTYLKRTCEEHDWKTRRAVVFLDPAGMQVEWSTLEALARTQAVDIWIWFPLSVNRMLTRSGEIEPAWQERLDRLFGTPEWREAFYRKEQVEGLFETTTQVWKVAGADEIARYFMERLRTILTAVAPHYAIMRNSRNSPIYALCFASANPGRGGKIAVSIADHLLKMQ